MNRYLDILSVVENTWCVGRVDPLSWRRVGFVVTVVMGSRCEPPSGRKDRNLFYLVMYWKRMR